MTLTLPRTRAFVLAIGSLLLLMIACTPQDEVVQLPEGVQTLEGILEKAELSLARRGTHVLIQDEEETYFVESPALNLRDYEGMDVTIKGEIEHNTSPDDAPVVVVQEISLSEVATQSWSVPAFGMTLAVPLSWSGALTQDGIRFSQSGSLDPLLTISASSLTRLPAGTPLIVGNERAVRDLSATGAELLYVQRGGEVIAVSYRPDEETTEHAASQLFTRVLRSIQFAASSSARSFGSGTSQTGTGSTKVIPCGGPNGILCPAGSYCEVTDRQSGIGTCRSLGR